MGRKKIRKFTASLLSVALLFTVMVVPAVYAAEEDTALTDKTPAIQEVQKEPDIQKEQERQKQGTETQEVLKTEEAKGIETDAENNSSGGADTINQKTIEVQAQIDALPTEEDLSGMGMEEQREAYRQVNEAYDAYEVLSKEEKAGITGAEVFEGLLGFFSSMTANTAENINVLGAANDSSSWFATKEKLLTDFDTDTTTGNTKPAKKVYFGQNGSGGPQEWWIVGQDPVGGGLVLFAASPLQTNKKFNTSTDEKEFSTDWGCTYDNNPEKVFSNHYGSSELRLSILKNIETDSNYFSSAEQDLLKTTTITTKDEKNNLTYTTSDKLYALYGNYLSSVDKYHITAGTNYAGALNGGLRIDKDYWGSTGFWLRAPCDFSLGNSADKVVYATYIDESNGEVYVGGNDCNSIIYGVVPAFQLNLSSVLFASAAPAASSEGKLTASDIFTLRYLDPTIGSANINQEKNKVTVTNAGTDTYLIVQNSDGAYAKSMSGSGTEDINASDITINNSQLTSFLDCKVWLEKTESDSRITKAVSANARKVKIQPGSHMTRQSDSGAEEQVVDEGQSITDIVYTADSGCFFPDDYTAGENGITVTRNSDTQITVSGIPTADIEITLPDAALPKAPAPTVGQSKTKLPTASTITVEELPDTGTYGTASYSINGTDWQASNVFEKLKAGTSYIVYAKYLGNTQYAESDPGSTAIVTANASYTISIPKEVTAGGTSEKIEVDESDLTNCPFDLGYGGQVNVKVKSGEKVSTQGVLTLTRQNDTSSTTLTSAMCVNDTLFTDITENVAVFKTKDDPAVSISFKEATLETGSLIPAGTYSGTVTFSIEYSQP